ncbi:MAG: STAS domain-containing protein [Bacteroidota bacterium]
MNVSLERKDKYAVVKVHEAKLTSGVAPELKAEIVMLHHEDFRNLIVDLSDVQYCDSSGLSAILVGYRLCRDANGMYLLSGVQDHVRKLISISQLDTMLQVVPTLNEAVDLIYMTEVEKQLHKED